MTEQQNHGEQLSQEEIVAEITKLIALMGQYNNLHYSVLAGEYINLGPMRQAANDSIENRERLQEAERLSSDIKGKMLELSLTSDEARSAESIASSLSYTMADLTVLRGYVKKVKELYQFLREKGWRDRDLGVVWQ